MNFLLNCAGFLLDLHNGLGATVCEGPQFELHAVKDEARVYLIGNGGSASIAGHIANDMCKASMKRAIALTDPAVMTCMANDYGYESVFSEQVRRLIEPEDWLIAISSSGRSLNILRAVDTARAFHAHVVTLSGFDYNNPLRVAGHTNYWVPSYNYGVVEIAHLAILHGIVNPGPLGN